MITETGKIVTTTQGLAFAWLSALSVVLIFIIWEYGSRYYMRARDIEHRLRAVELAMVERIIMEGDSIGKKPN